MPSKSNPGWVYYRFISRQYIPCLDTAMDSQPITEANPTSVGEASGMMSDSGELKWPILKENGCLVVINDQPINNTFWPILL